MPVVCHSCGLDPWVDDDHKGISPTAESTVRNDGLARWHWSALTAVGAIYFRMRWSPPVSVL